MFGKAPRGISERPKTQSTPKSIPSWLWMIVLVLAGVCLMIFLILWRPWQPSAQHNINVAADPATQETNKDYRFYDLLPQQQVTPIPEQAIPVQKNASPSPTMVIQAPEAVAAPTEVVGDPLDGSLEMSIATEPRYILQIRSYEDPDQADARRAEIILNGLSAEVVIGNEKNKIWYRVVSGPYYSEESAKIAQQTLQNGGIDSFIVQQNK